MIAQSMIVKVTLLVGLPQSYNIISVTLLVDTFLESLIFFFLVDIGFMDFMLSRIL